MKKVFLLVVLAMASNSTFAAMTETCQQYFKEMDTLIEQASKTNEQAKQQLEAMKPQLEESKKQLEKSSGPDQDTACKQALSAMAQLKQGLGLK
ncbi:DUF5339 family protein [Kluyvera sichuanensis]|uniref:DUF5339 family protein n=1 Tax=Kluyvera sichuanensis TaxID=2725494 RepID=UPI0039F735FC